MDVFKEKVESTYTFHLRLDTSSEEKPLPSRFQPTELLASLRSLGTQNILSRWQVV